MPAGTRVHDCVNKLKKEGKEEGSAIAICQSSTKQSFHTGKPIKSLKAPKVKGNMKSLRSKYGKKK